MSSIATSYVVNADVPAKLDETPAKWDELIANTQRNVFGWSGYVIAGLLPYLAEQGIALMDSPHGEPLSKARGTTCVVLEVRHRGLIDRLATSEHDPARMRGYFEELFGGPAEGVEAAMVDGLTFLRAALNETSESKSALLVID